MIERNFKLENIKEVSEQILKEIKSIEKDKALIVALRGNLGAGKTTLVKQIAKNLGIKENLISPTFVIMKFYKTKDLKFKKVIHIDAYRLESKDELNKIGFYELLEDKSNLIFIEWPENIDGAIGKDAFFINIDHIDETTRKIKFWYND